MTARATQGRQFHRFNAPKPVECVGGVELHVAAGRSTARAAELWAQRTDALAAWLAAEWQNKWTSRCARGRGCDAVTVPPEDLESGSETTEIEP
jgi:hypothetical protein